MTKVCNSLIRLLAGVLVLAFWSAPAAAQPTPIGACGATISVPGSYVLTGNLTVPSASTTPCIKVTVGPTTIDLDGFAIIGNSKATGVFIAPQNVVSVLNGTIKTAAIGINAASATVTFRNLTIVQSSGDGAVAGDNAQVSESRFINNLGNGLSVGDNALVSNCTFKNNSLHGLVALANGTYQNNTSDSNSGDNFHSAGLSTFTGNTANNSQTGSGFNVACPTNLIGNTALQNSAGSFTISSGVGCKSVNNLGF